MATHPFTISLLGAALLLGATSCSRPDATPVGTGSYQLDGRPISCQATASLYTGYKGTDLLTISLTTTPQPADGPESLTMYFQKVKGHPDTDYTPMDAYYSSNGQSLAQSTRYLTPQMTIAPTASGGFSGTVAASLGSPTTGTIQNGIFTNAYISPSTPPFFR